MRLITRVLVAWLLVTAAGSPTSGQRVDSLDLRSALAVARSKSPVLAAAQAREQGARGVVTTARSRRLPRLSAEALYLRFEDPPGIARGPLGALTPIPMNSYFVQVGVQQPLYTAGRISEGVRAADWMQRSSTAATRQADVELSAAVAHAYDAVLLMRALLGVSQTAAALLDSAVAVAKARFEAGVVARIDILRAETRRASALTEVRAQRDALESALDRLATAIDVAPNELPPIAGVLEPAALSLDSIAAEALVASVSDGRPDVAALRAASEAAQARARAAGASTKPAAAVFLSSLTMRPELVSQEKRWATKWYGGVVMSWPIFDFGAADGEAQAARADAARASAEAAQIVRGSVASALAQLRELRRAEVDITAGRENVQRAERALAIAQERYVDGTGIQLEVLEAEADLTRARADVLRAVHAHRSAAVELRRALGRSVDAPLTVLRSEER